MRATNIYRFRSAPLHNNLGSPRGLKGSVAGIRGSAQYRYARAITLNAATQAKVMRHPSARPTTRPRGRPAIKATDDPITTIPIAE